MNMPANDPARKSYFIDPVDPDIFREALELACAIVNGSAEAPDPSKFSLEIEDYGTISFVDRLDTRIDFAIIERFKGRADSVAISIRLFALKQAVRMKAIINAGHVQVQNDDTQISNELIAAMATVRLHERKRIKSEAILAELERGN